MISLEKTVFNGEALQALVAMQSEYTNLAQIKECAKYFSESHDNEYQAIAIFNDGTMLHITTDEDGELQYNNEWESDFIAFCLLMGKEGKLDIGEAEDLFCKVAYFNGSQKEFYDYLVEYYYNNYHSLSDIINFVDNEAYLYDGCLRDCAEEFINDTQDLSPMGVLANYIDYDSYGEDMVLSSEWEKINNQLIWMNPRDL